MRRNLVRAVLPISRGLLLQGLLLLGLPSAGAAEPAAPATPAAPITPATPAAPGTPPGAAPAAPPGAAGPSAANPRPGIVRLERGGRRLGFGVVLRSDGRILTALSAIGHGNYVRARFFDDHVLGVRVVETLRAWDLALLAPEGGHWTEGLRASSVDAAAEGVRLRRFGGRGREISETAATIKGRQALLGRDGVMLEDALLLGGSVAEDELGSPLCDDAGDVIALVGQACDPAVQKECRPSMFGVPVSAIKQFLRNAPAREPLPAAWLGLRGVAAHSGSVAGVRLIAVDAGSPAEQAGLRAQPSNGDLVVAVDDAPVTTPEELRDAINRIALAASNTAPQRAGSTSAASKDAASNDNKAAEPAVRLLVYGTGRFREVNLPLRAPLKIPASP